MYVKSTSLEMNNYITITFALHCRGEIKNNSVRKISENTFSLLHYELVTGITRKEVSFCGYFCATVGRRNNSFVTGSLIVSCHISRHKTSYFSGWPFYSTKGKSTVINTKYVLNIFLLHCATKRLWRFFNWSKLSLLAPLLGNIERCCLVTTVQQEWSNFSPASQVTSFKNVCQ